MTPDQHTLQELMLDVGNGHQLYVQDWGNPKVAKTIIYLHGGPGSGVSDDKKSIFNPTTQRVIFFDQRGCGRSLPYGSLEHNTTQDLVEDISKVADACQVDSFVLTGGSWGSLLALAYALEYPSRVERMVLRGVFTGRKEEIAFIDEGGMKVFFPEAWEEYTHSVPAKYRQKPANYHFQRMFGEDEEAIQESTRAYRKLEGAVMRLDDRTRPDDPSEEFDPAPGRIECHYLGEGCFLPEGYILKNAHKLTMPIDIVQGRYDAVCPPITAYELSKKLPNCTLNWTIAGHSGNDRANWELLKSLLARP